MRRRAPSARLPPPFPQLSRRTMTKDPAELQSSFPWTSDDPAVVIINIITIFTILYSVRQLTTSVLLPPSSSSSLDEDDRTEDELEESEEDFDPAQPRGPSCRGAACFHGACQHPEHRQLGSEERRGGEGGCGRCESRWGQTETTRKSNSVRDVVEKGWSTKR